MFASSQSGRSRVITSFVLAAALLFVAGSLLPGSASADRGQRSVQRVDKSHFSRQPWRNEGRVLSRGDSGRQRSFERRIAPPRHDFGRGRQAAPPRHDFGRGGHVVPPRHDVARDRHLWRGDAWRGGRHEFRGHRFTPWHRPWFANDWHRWRGGHWQHGWHHGHIGWWWVVAGSWYLYAAPVYPYPDPWGPEVVFADTVPLDAADNGYWYYCTSAQAYYPYVKQCPEGWQQVPATPPSVN